jgi:hypothetical protein
MGTSAIRGFVIDGERELLTKEKPFIEVLLFNSRMDPLTFTVTDYTGDFEFTELPLGTYNLQVEAPGLYSRLITLTLENGHNIADSVVLEVFDHDVTGIENHQIAQTVYVSALYPNPANDGIWFDVSSQKKSTLIIEIVNIAGQIMHTRTIEIIAGKTQVFTIVNSLSKGFYFLLIHSGEGVLIDSQKFLKY